MKIKLIGAAVYGLLSNQLWAETTYETAPVIEIRPIYKVVEVSTPQEQCWEEEILVGRVANGQGSETPVLLSTIIGAL